MPFLVDGDNVLGVWPGRTRSGADKRALAREIDRLARRDRKAYVVVFDGTPPDGVGYGAEVVFSGPGRTADAVIVDRLRGAARPRETTVVTQDRALADRCRTLGASIESARDFRNRLSRSGDGVEEKPDGRVDVDYWLDAFEKKPPPT